MWSITCSYKYNKNLADATGSPVGVSGYTALTPTGGAAVLSHRDTPHRKQANLHYQAPMGLGGSVDQRATNS